MKLKLFLFSIFCMETMQTAIGLVTEQFLSFYTCIGSDDVVTWFENGRSAGDDNQYIVDITTPTNYSQNLVDFKLNMTVQFDSEANVTMFGGTGLVMKLNETLTVIELDNNPRGPLTTAFTVRGRPGGNVPYITSIILYDKEQCNQPRLGYLDKYIQDYKIEMCGSRGIAYAELMYNGEPTTPGDWPWHAAIYHHNVTKNIYQCGGTLISRTLVLTAAHCLINGKMPVAPADVLVVLGKYNLTEGDVHCQEKQVSSLMIHEHFRKPEHDDNDIALLKLKTEAIYNHYVQPACIWNSQASSRLQADTIYGSVAGWGLDETNSLSAQLKHATLPVIPNTVCINKKPMFYATLLKDEKKFCAGWLNGTLPCRGDSGSGFMVFVPDTSEEEEETSGRWYIMGLVSLAVVKDKTMCDPEYYVVFTNISLYQDWMMDYRQRFT